MEKSPVRSDAYFPERKPALKRAALNNVVRNRAEQCCAALQLSTVLFSIITPDSDTTIVFHYC